jgi:hypothetical protein
MSEQNEASPTNRAPQKTTDVSKPIVSSIYTSSESAAYVTQSVFCTVPLANGTHPLKRDS